MCTAFKDAKTKIKVTCNYFAQNPSLTSSWGILLDLIHYFISARSVSGLSQDQSGSGVPRDHSIQFTCQCQDFYTVWRIQQQQHSKPGLWATFIFFLLGQPTEYNHLEILAILVWHDTYHLLVIQRKYENKNLLTDTKIQWKIFIFVNEQG